MSLSTLRSVFLLGLLALLSGLPCARADTYEDSIRPLLKSYCVNCHGAEEANGDVDFSKFPTQASVSDDYAVWETAVKLVNDGVMPPADEAQPTADEKAKLNDWYQKLIDSVEPHPGFFRPRRLSAHEYRNTLESLLGLTLDVAIMEAEQTVVEKSLVMKLLPTDPPGASGFKNDTSGNPLTTVIWDQYSYLVDNGLERLFSVQQREVLETHVGKIEGEFLSQAQAKQLLQTMTRRAYRRPVDQATIDPALNAIADKSDRELEQAVRTELKRTLMSPPFIYRGLLIDTPRDSQQTVDDHELAERLSYFLWGDMPDAELFDLAEKGQLEESKNYRQQIARMLASPKARSLAENMGVEWFSLNEINHASNNPPVVDALRTQPIDFLNYLFTQGRPLTELIDCDTTFINPHTAKYYPQDRKQMGKYSKQRGIEVESVANQKIKLNQTSERGGLLTMPGVLAMNKGPVIRGTWILERVLGDHLPDPPADVGQVPTNKRGEKLTFRERFELHRSNPTCASCHDKIDPLGFALESYSATGGYIKSANFAAQRGKVKKKDRDKPQPDPKRIDTSGRLPSGESFDDYQGLKQILVTSQKERVIRNIVRRTMSYALCRKLEIHDHPTVEAIVADLDQNNGTFHDLIEAIANSLPFKETLVKSK